MMYPVWDSISVTDFSLFCHVWWKDVEIEHVCNSILRLMHIV